MKGVQKLVQSHAICARNARLAQSDITRDRWLEKAKYYRDMIDCFPWIETEIKLVREG